MSLNLVFPSIYLDSTFCLIFCLKSSLNHDRDSPSKLKKRRHNGILCKKKLLHKGEKLAGKSKQLYSFKQIIKIVRFFWYCDPQKKKTQLDIRFTRFMKTPKHIQYSASSGVGGASALTVALKLPNSWTKLTFVYR